MRTWYTQPPSGFASFYCYKKRSRELVRIRLELNRTEVFGNHGQTTAVYFRNRYVGFALNNELDTRAILQFQIQEGAIVHGTYGVMQNTPVLGLFVYDFESAEGDYADMPVHRGNAVVAKELARLPRDVTERDLLDIANVCFGRRKTLVLTNRNASEEQLISAIKAAAAELTDVGGARIGQRLRTEKEKERKKTGGVTKVKKSKVKKSEEEESEEEESKVDFPGKRTTKARPRKRSAKKSETGQRRRHHEKEKIDSVTEGKKTEEKESEEDILGRPTTTTTTAARRRVTWYTRPKKNFASFYCYDESSREMVRIRLELGRPVASFDMGNTGAVYCANCYVGFSETNELDNRKLNDFGVVDGLIHHATYGVMTNVAAANLFTYDFESPRGDRPELAVHKGNAVVEKKYARLPGGIREMDLQAVADVCFLYRKDIKLTERNAKERELAEAIKAVVVGRYKVGRDITEPEWDIVGGTTTTTTTGRPFYTRRRTEEGTTTTTTTGGPFHTRRRTEGIATGGDIEENESEEEERREEERKVKRFQEDILRKLPTKRRRRGCGIM